MADASTTDSTVTTEAQTGAAATETATTGSPDTSTTEKTGAPAKAEEPTGTVLTGEAPAKTEEEIKAEAEGKTKAEAEAKTTAPNEFFGAPENGEYKVEGLPEGTVIDEKALEAVVPVAKEMGLSNAGLSKIAAVYAEKVLPQVVDQFNDQMQQNIAATRAEWAKSSAELVKTDPVFKGSSLVEVQAVAAKALDRFGGEDFRKFLLETGLGDNPTMVKFAYLAGSMISEDTTFERGSTAPAPKSRTEKYYGPQS